MAYYKKGNSGLAIDLLEEAVRKAPRNATYLYHLGLAHQMAGNLSKAKSVLEQALKIDPESPLAEDIRAALRELE